MICSLLMQMNLLGLFLSAERQDTGKGEKNGNFYYGYP